MIDDRTAAPRRDVVVLLPHRIYSRPAPLFCVSSYAVRYNTHTHIHALLLLLLVITFYYYYCFIFQQHERV